MSKSLYVTATEPRSGKSAILLGLMHLLTSKVPEVAFFRPIISSNHEGHRDHDINLILSEYKLNLAYEDTYCYSLHEARELINKEQHSILLENILTKYKALEEKYDAILCEGTDYLGTESAFEFDLNADMAENLGCPVLLIASGFQKTTDETIESTQLTIESLDNRELDIIAVVINRFSGENGHQVSSKLKFRSLSAKPPLVYIIPELASLGNPTIKDVVRSLGAKVLYGHERLEAQIDSYLVAAMQIHNFLNYVEPNSLVITPGDRSDILLSCLVSRLSTLYPDISGILLTGGLLPEDNVHRLIKGWAGVPIPILSVHEHTYKTTQKLNEMYSRINPDDHKKITSALGLFESNVDVEELRARFVALRSTKVTPKMFEYSLIQKAKSNKQRVVLPEGTEERILRATEILLRRDVADITLLGKEEEIRAKISQLGLQLERAQIVQPDQSPHFEDYIRTYHEARKHRGILEEDARDRMSDMNYFGTMMVYKNHADAMVSGSITTTAHTILPAFEIIKTKPGASIVSSVFFMCLKNKVLVFGDCAVNPDPNPEQLAEIAISSAQTAKIFGIEPRVAMLSYSTGLSGTGEQVEKVIQATQIAHKQAPELLLEGPLQYDAAIDPLVAKTKLPESKVAGQATVFVFPDLNTGNNTYKAVQRAAQAVAIGPVLQGLNKPVNDLSRGCSVADIVNTVAITAIQAQKS